MNKVTIKSASGSIITEFETEHNHILVNVEPVKPDLSVEITSMVYTRYLAPRSIGSLAYKAYYLDPTFNWELKKDNNGVLCLVPTKKI